MGRKNDEQSLVQTGVDDIVKMDCTKRSDGTLKPIDYVLPMRCTYGTKRIFLNILN